MATWCNHTRGCSLTLKTLCFTLGACMLKTHHVLDMYKPQTLCWRVYMQCTRQVLNDHVAPGACTNQLYNQTAVHKSCAPSMLNSHVKLLAAPTFIKAAVLVCTSNKADFSICNKAPHVRCASTLLHVNKLHGSTGYEQTTASWNWVHSITKAVDCILNATKKLLHSQQHNHRHTNTMHHTHSQSNSELDHSSRR
jgi:hypothetical protein